MGQVRAVVWLTGIPNAGKTSIARAVAARLSAEGQKAFLIDGDELRAGLCSDLGFSPDDRVENIRRAGEAARLLFNQGAIVLCALVSPYRQARDRVRALLPPGCFMEVHVTAAVDTCRRRDSKGLYARAADGHLPDLTGVSAPYEAPIAPDLVIDTDVLTIDAAADLLIARMRALSTEEPSRVLD
jgi:bifunctional enzyme CysN/CysC